MDLSYGVIQGYMEDYCAAFSVDNSSLNEQLVKIDLGQLGEKYQGLNLLVASTNSIHHTHDMLVEHTIQEINCCQTQEFIIKVEGAKNQTIKITAEDEMELFGRAIKCSHCCDDWTPISYGKLIQLEINTFKSSSSSSRKRTGLARKCVKRRSSSFSKQDDNSVITSNFVFVLENPIGFPGFPKQKRDLIGKCVYFKGGVFATEITPKKLSFDDNDTKKKEEEMMVLTSPAKSLQHQPNFDVEDMPTQKCSPESEVICSDDEEDVPPTQPVSLQRKYITKLTKPCKSWPKKLKL
jgi:hypothetical protein